jgi:probable DNA metabolism protein
MQLVYDGSLEGWLTGVFDIYERKLSQVKFCRADQNQSTIFNDHYLVVSDERKAKRVWKGLQLRLTSRGLNEVYRSFLSEISGIDNTLLSYVCHAFNSKGSIECDFSNPDVLTVSQTARKVYREKHRMEAFVRFQRTADELYYAVIDPDFNVLPLIRNHFKERYADQRWLIYDSRRKYGIFYDLHNVSEVQMEFSDDVQSSGNIAAIHHPEEKLYQELWQRYFSSVNIAARKNIKLHIRHMPLRYWKYLPEKWIKDNHR